MWNEIQSKQYVREDKEIQKDHSCLYCCNLIYGHFIYFHISDIHSKDYLWRTVKSDGWSYSSDVFKFVRCNGNKMGLCQGAM